MKKISKRFLSIITAFVLILGSTSVMTNVAALEANEVIILHTNDMHGQMDEKVLELAYVKAYKDHVKATAIIDGGDAFQGLPLNNLTKGAKLAEIMNVIGYDAMAIGNHEFDYTRGVALGLEDGWAKSATFPLLSSNILYKDAKLGTVGTTVYEPGVVLNKKDNNGNDLKISVIGASTPETYVKADPRHTEGLEITNPIQAVKAEIVKTKYADSDIYVVTVHLGIDKETKSEWRGDTLALELSKMPELVNKRVIVIDGHSHTEHTEKYGTNVLYGQTGGSLSHLGEITINLDDFSKSAAKVIQLRDKYDIGAIKDIVTPDAVIKTMLEAAEAEFDELTKGVVLDNLPIELIGERDLVRSKETNLGNLIADSMLEYALDTFPLKSDVAVMNGGGIRASLPANKPITLKDVLTVMPYGNRVVQIDVTGAQMYEMYEHALKAPAHETDVDANGLPLLKSDPAILHSSDSIRVHYDSRLPIGERIIAIKIMDPETGKMNDVDLKKIYKVVTLEFLAVGGDGFKMLGGARVEGKNDADVLTDYLLAIDSKFDWSPYEATLPTYRIIAGQYYAEGQDVVTFNKLVSDSKVKLDKKGEYTTASLATFEKAYNEVQAIYKRLAANEQVTVYELEDAQSTLELASKNLVLRKDIPPTGISSGIFASMATISAASAVLVVLRKRNN